MLKGTQTKALKIQFTIITDSVCVEQCYLLVLSHIDLGRFVLGIEWKINTKKFICSDIHDIQHTSSNEESEV